MDEMGLMVTADQNLARMRGEDTRTDYYRPPMAGINAFATFGYMMTGIANNFMGIRMQNRQTKLIDEQIKNEKSRGDHDREMHELQMKYSELLNKQNLENSRTQNEAILEDRKEKHQKEMEELDREHKNNGNLRALRNEKEIEETLAIKAKTKKLMAAYELTWDQCRAALKKYGMSDEQIEETIKKSKQKIEDEFDDDDE